MDKICPSNPISIFFITSWCPHKFLHTVPISITHTNCPRKYDTERCPHKYYTQATFFHCVPESWFEIIAVPISKFKINSNLFQFFKHSNQQIYTLVISRQTSYISTRQQAAFKLNILFDLKL